MYTSDVVRDLYCDIEDQEDIKRKHVWGLVAKIIVICVIIAYMFSGTYQTMKRKVDYYKNNPDAKTFGEALEDADVDVPTNSSFYSMKTNASQKKQSAIRTFEMLNGAFIITVIACAGFAVRNVVMIVLTNREIKTIENLILEQMRKERLEKQNQ